MKFQVIFLSFLFSHNAFGQTGSYLCSEKVSATERNVYLINVTEQRTVDAYDVHILATSEEIQPDGASKVLFDRHEFGWKAHDLDNYIRLGDDGYLFSWQEHGTNVSFQLPGDERAYSFSNCAASGPGVIVHN